MAGTLRMHLSVCKNSGASFVKAPMLKQLRSKPVLNGLIRNTIAQLTSNTQRATDWLTSRWRVAGQVGVDVMGHHLIMAANADDGILNRLFYGQEWEQGELNAWRLLVGDARCVLDVGANTGVYSLLSAAIRPRAQVFAFEPHPVNFDRLTTNLSLNAATNVEAVPQAVGDHSGTIEFTIPADDQISLVASAVRPFAEAHFGIPYKQHKVPQTTVDDFVAQRRLDSVDLVKIDVEYYELSVLKGAERTLEKQAPVLLCEVFDYEIFAHHHPELAGKISSTQHLEVQELLKNYGYHFYYVGKEGLLRVSDLHSNLDGGSNFVFSRVKTNERFLPWSRPQLVRSLMARPAGEPSRWFET
jgi:FkbM family methyltransferase